MVWTQADFGSERRLVSVWVATDCDYGFNQSRRAVQVLSPAEQATALYLRTDRHRLARRRNPSPKGKEKNHALRHVSVYAAALLCMTAFAQSAPDRIRPPAILPLESEQALKLVPYPPLAEPAQREQ
ncbi:DUF6130 family protein [Cupriavidus neocaledonicus]|nr:DUF6130 family protein [Cupriavidus neocaledonicus]